MAAASAGPSPEAAGDDQHDQQQHGGRRPGGDRRHEQQRRPRRRLAAPRPRRSRRPCGRSRPKPCGHYRVAVRRRAAPGLDDAATASAESNGGSIFEQSFETRGRVAAPSGSAAPRSCAPRRASSARRGFAAAGMRDIAVAADLSPANLYHYFGGKDEILFFCQDRTLDRLHGRRRRARRDRRRRPPARLRALAAAHVRCIVDEVEGSAAHFEVDALAGPPAHGGSSRKRDRYERAVRALVAAGMRRGELARSRCRPIATRAFLGALNWTVQWFRPDGALPARADCHAGRRLRRRRLGEHAVEKTPASRSPSTANRPRSRSRRTKRCSRCCVRT